MKFSLLMLALSIFAKGTIPVPFLYQQVLQDQNPRAPEAGLDGFSLPVFDPHAEDREFEIAANREGYQYGPPLLGNTSFFPAGVLGERMVLRDKQLWFEDVAYVTEKVNKVEIPSAARALANAGGLQNLSSYAAVYDGQWQYSIPDGASPGTLTNWTHDLLFSMERLSNNPYVVSRIQTSDSLPFHVDQDTVRKLAAGLDLRGLHSAGRLFFGNHSIQATYPTNPVRYTAACSAYFFIHPESGDFLPLAIKTNVGADLVYTPLDNENDWTFAKMAFNMNDFFHGQNFHLATSHDVAEPVHQAALRTLSERHPVRGYLDRIMYQAYAVRPIGDEVLFNQGGFFDQSFAVNNKGGRLFAQQMYPISAGRFRSSQFFNDLRLRGLIDYAYGPSLKRFPFHEDVAPMMFAIRRFAETYVNAYYTSEAFLQKDRELQAWMREAHEGAQVLDFPPYPLADRETLISILSHVAFLSGISHHVLNAATPGESSGLLPMHPSAFFLPLPTRKGQITNLLDYLHNETEAIKQASLLVRFNRPQIEEQGGELASMWSGTDFLAAVNSPVERAAKAFKDEMWKISDGIRGKIFDEDGLCQGMPYIWRSLDPRRIPYYLSV